MCQSKGKSAQRTDDRKRRHGEYGQHTVEWLEALGEGQRVELSWWLYRFALLQARESGRWACCASNSWLSRGPVETRLEAKSNVAKAARKGLMNRDEFFESG